MFIYLITNLINGKQYVGRTTRKNPTKRWNEHKKDGSKNRAVMVISRAIQKYGCQNFKFEVIDTADDIDSLARKESFYIQKYNTMAPNGYNVEFFQEGRVVTEETKQRISRSQQGLKKKANCTSRYMGVFKQYKGWAMVLAKDKIDYTFYCKTEEEAAILYDKTALYLYGPEAKVNFPDRAAEYTKKILEDNIEYVTRNKKTSKYHYVDYVNSLKKWRACIKISGTTRARTTESEIEAAEFSDVVRVIFNKAKREEMNFPEKYDKYITLDEEWLEAKTLCKGGGVGRSRNGKFTARINIGGTKYWLGTFSTKEEAEQALENKKKECKTIWII